MKSNRFYLACLRDTVGTSVSFHCKNGKGYSTNIKEAHEYTLEEAQAKWNRGREIDLPLDANQVDKLAVSKVDCQYVPGKSAEINPTEKYVGYMKGRWNGNDLYWMRACDTPTDHYNLASVYTGSQLPSQSDEIVWLPVVTTTTKSRKTFNINLLNRRKLVQGAGLRVPDGMKRKSRAKPDAKTRWNCPGCGHITWQHNPRDFEGCKDIECKEWVNPYRLMA